MKIIDKTIANGQTICFLPATIVGTYKSSSESSAVTTTTSSSFTAAFTSRVNSFVSVTSPHVKVAVNFTSVSSSGQVIANLPLLTTAHGLSETQVIVNLK